MTLRREVCRRWPVLAVLTFAFLIPASATAKSNKLKSYLERGVVIATRSTREFHSTGTYTDAWGRTWGGVTNARRVPVYRIETGSRYFDLEQMHPCAIFSGMVEPTNRPRDACLIFAERIVDMIRDSGMTKMEALAALRCADAVLSCANDIGFSAPSPVGETESRA